MAMAQLQRHCVLRMSPMRMARRSSTVLGFRPPRIPPPGRPFSNHGQPPSAVNSFLPIPFITETMGGAYLSYDLFSRLLKERIVCLFGEVNSRTAATIVAQLLYLEAENPDKPINLYINSPGGSITDGMAIYDTMTYVTPDIVTICMGQAASMGSLLLCAGTPGHRFALPHASIMVHQPSGGYFGQATDVAIHAKEILRVKKQLIETYRKHMTKEHSPEEIESLIDRDRFMTAEEAVGFGLIDKIFTRRGER